VIAATASALGATLVQKDPEFEALAEEIPLLALPFKKRRS
jgi:predicted nucleic acid-binding protein